MTTPEKVKPMPTTPKEKVMPTTSNKKAIRYQSGPSVESLLSKSFQHHEQSLKLQKHVVDMAMEVKNVSTEFHKQSIQRAILEKVLPVQEELVAKAKEKIPELEAGREEYEKLLLARPTLNL